MNPSQLRTAGLGQPTPDVQFQNRGLHEGLAQILQRICGINSSLDSALQRIHGPRPMATGAQGKNPETPSIVVIASNIDEELSALERLSADLCKFIG